MGDRKKVELPVEVFITNEQIIVKEFICTLEALPELWDSSHKDYADKFKRAAAHKKLLKVYRKIKPTATADDVRKKINSLRSNYRKELKRIEVSKRSAADEDEVYTPKSWTFKALQFLNINEQPVNGSVVSEHESDPLGNASSASMKQLNDSSFSSVNQLLPPRKKTKLHPIHKQNAFIQKACVLLSEKPENSANIVNATALYWSEKLHNLQPKQRMFAEKAINDILFEAQLGNLNINSVVINRNATSTVTSPEQDNAHSVRYECFIPVSSDTNIYSSTSSPEYIIEENSGLRSDYSTNTKDA